jgi:hypothetical protein
VDFLTNAFKNVTASQKIYLSKGIYDLSPLTNAPLYAPSGNGYGAALLGFPWIKNIKVIGATGNPRDVVLMAKDSKYRILALSPPNSELYNVTITGGMADSTHVDSYNYRRGGGVLLGHQNIVSNCIFYANKASVGGGAISGANNYFGNVYDCVFYGNDCNIPGMAACYTTLHRCTFTNNVSVGEAAKDSGASVTTLCNVYDSYFANNRANGTGGVDRGTATRCTFVNNTQGNLVQNDDATNAGGGGARNAALTNCYFYGNTAFDHGGAIFGGSAVGCTVISNSVRRTNDVYAYGGGICSATLVEGCTVASNVAPRGGGLASCAIVRNTDLLYNKATEGGGARSSALENCFVAHNVALKYANGCAGGAGGGMAEGAATNCVFRDNSASTAYDVTCLKNCDISGTSLHASRIEDCVFHEMDNAFKYRAVGNVCYPEGHLASNIFMVGGARFVRNCLFTNCSWKAGGGNFYNASVFEPGRGVVTARVENCTFADNSYYWLVRNYNTPTQLISIANSVFFGNTYSSRAKDVGGNESPYLVLSNCVYGALGDRTGRTPIHENYGCTSITARAAYKFTGKEPNPYSLKRSSPLRGWGLLLDWMEDGTDLAGNPRLRDGAVDIGCYQCWLDPVGAVFSIR